MNPQPLFPILNGQYQMDREPDVRIGVILEEDNKKEVIFTLPDQDYIITGGPQEIRVQGSLEGAFTVRFDQGKLDLHNHRGEPILIQAGIIQVKPVEKDIDPEPGAGIQVKDIVAGRGFHWSKFIDQTLTGQLEFHAKNNSILMVNQLPIEEYLTGVITGEMSGECPEEFMKSQAVAARSWLLATPFSTHPDEPFDWCNDDHCQRYQGTGGWSSRAIRAIRACRGEVLITESNRYCDARYSKSCGGISEASSNVWPEPIEGLEPVLDAPQGSNANQFFPLSEETLKEYILGDWTRQTDIFCSPAVVPEETLSRYLGRVDEEGRYFRWERSYTQEDLCRSLKIRGGIQDLAKVLNLRPIHRGSSGRLNRMEVDYLTPSGEIKTFIIKSEYNIRSSMDMNFLFSGAFLIDFYRDNRGNLIKITLKGAGWGHGAGFCQIGALGMALKNYSYQDILLHYYQGVRIETVY